MLFIDGKKGRELYARNRLNLRFKSTNLGPKKCYTNQAERSKQADAGRGRHRV